ncbi:MAG: hypothetical protein ACP5FX_03130 [Candidatus Micrarchaeia archaeon]
MEKEKVNKEKLEKVLNSLYEALPLRWEKIESSGAPYREKLDKETNILVVFKLSINDDNKKEAKDALKRFMDEVNEKSVLLHQQLKKNLEDAELIKNFDELFDSKEFNLLKEKIKKEYEDYKAEKEKKEKRSFNERMEGNEENKVNKEREQKKESILEKIQQKLRELHFPYP